MLHCTVLIFINIIILFPYVPTYTLKVSLNEAASTRPVVGLILCHTIYVFSTINSYYKEYEDVEKERKFKVMGISQISQ